jgi:acetyl-CoA carboxylase carboxyltransferase component
MSTLRTDFSENGHARVRSMDALRAERDRLDAAAAAGGDAQRQRGQGKRTALASGAPIIGINDSGGARVQEV